MPVIPPEQCGVVWTSTLVIRQLAGDLKATEKRTQQAIAMSGAMLNALRANFRVWDTMATEAILWASVNIAGMLLAYVLDIFATYRDIEPPEALKTILGSLSETTLAYFQGRREERGIVPVDGASR